MPTQNNLQPPPEFDPFQDRLCRDIRNDLSEGLLTMLQLRDMGVLLPIAEGYRQRGLAPHQQEYIDDRLSRYRTVLQQMETEAIGKEEIYAVARLLWNQGLFFEVHEWLEHHWLTAVDPDKAIFQALIRAAGTYVHLEHGRLIGARKMAARAVEALTRHQALIPPAFPVAELIVKLSALDPLPPKLTVSCTIRQSSC